MQNYTDGKPEPPGFNTHAFLSGLRAAGAVIGLLTIGIGLTYTLKLLALILNALKNPEKVEQLLSLWKDALGGEQLDIYILDVSVHGAPLLAIAVMGGLTLLLPKISIALISAGAKILSSTLGDKEAIKKILNEAFGRSRGTASQKDTDQPTSNSKNEPAS